VVAKSIVVEKKKIVKGIKMLVNEDFLQKFKETKEFLGLESDSEVIRYLVNFFYREVVLPVRVQTDRDKQKKS